MTITTKLVESILDKNLNKANETISEVFVEILKDKLIEMKKMVAAKYGVAELVEELENIDEGNVTKMGRMKMIKARIRGGKVQRRVRRSAVPGMTLRGGKLVRMSPTERRARKMGARKGKIKRRAKLARALMKRKRSLAKRKAMGLR